MTTINPSDVTTGEYIFLNECCKYGDSGDYESITLLTTLSGMSAGESKEVTISGGCPPYTWDAPLPLSFTSYYTTTVSNTLYLAEGAEAQPLPIDITIVDVCYNQGSPAATKITTPIYIV